MIELSYAKITHPGFQGALRKLYGQPLPTKTAFDLRTLSKRIEQKLKDVDDARFELLHKYAQKDEDGKFIPNKDENGKEIPGSIMPIEGKEEELQKEFIGYLQTKAEFKGHKFKVDDFESATLSAQDIDLLEDILEV